ncbi:Hypothetical predicted protein, partial [Marmota monax]
MENAGRHKRTHGSLHRTPEEVLSEGRQWALKDGDAVLQPKGLKQFRIRFLNQRRTTVKQ